MVGMDIRAGTTSPSPGPTDGPVVMLAHGFGCDQNMWRLVVPGSGERYRVVLFDYVGSGGSDLVGVERGAVRSLDGYAAGCAWRSARSWTCGM